MSPIKNNLLKTIKKNFYTNTDIFKTSLFSDFKIKSRQIRLNLTGINFRRF
jgi:hypothetical protein